MVTAYLNIGVHSGPLDRVSLSEENQRPGHHWDVLQHLLLDLRQGGDVGEVALVLTGHPLGRLQVGDFSADEVGEHSDRFVRLVVLLEDGLVGVGNSVSDQHDGLVGLCSDLKSSDRIIMRDCD